MGSLTVRRWVDAPPREVWRRMVDLDDLVVCDPELVLVEVNGDQTLHRGTHARISRRRGARLATLDLTVVAADAPYRLVLCVSIHRTRWTVRIELAPCAKTSTDLLLQAELDPATSGRLGLRSLVGAADSSAGRDLLALLESVARRAERVPAPV